MPSRAKREAGFIAVMLAMAALPGAGISQGTTAAYPAMAPLEQYRMSRDAEIAMARSAAPASVSTDADVLVLGAAGYENAVKGRNGFVCIVERSWAVNFDDPEFWNPKTRGPVCYNPAASRTVLPAYVSRTKWVLSGASRADMEKRSTGAAAVSVSLPEVGAMAYMLSPAGYLGDAVRGAWHPHVMFFLPRTTVAGWGADREHSPVFVVDSGRVVPWVTFAVPVPRWSDGTPDSSSVR